jgi:hypothetical protein
LDYLDIQSILPTQLTHHQSAKKSSDEEDKSTLPERYLFVPFQIETDGDSESKAEEACTRTGVG